MPELPEVETIRASLAPVLVATRLTRIEVRRPDLRFPFPDRFAERLLGRTVAAVSRRGKYLIVDLDGPEVLILHLGMSGRFMVGQDSGRGVVAGVYVYDTGALPQHDHVVFHTERGDTITYNDPRRFGFMLLVARDELDRHALFHAMGMEPLGNAMSAEVLALRAAGRRTDLKAFLMDQRNIAGLGNIYVCEALFRAGLSPLRRAASLATRTGKPTLRAERLVPAIRAVLQDAVAAGGSTLRDYRRADGSPGQFQEAHAVYDREGEACMKPGCGGTVRRLTQAQRSTFYCPKCQR